MEGKYAHGPMDVHSMWQSVTENAGDDQGVYFYGTPGAFPSSSEPSSSSNSACWATKASFKDVVGDDAAQPILPAPARSKPSCRFFQAGNCKFGSRCRFSHVIDKDMMHRSSGMVGQVKECGICIEPLPTAMYGLLSHCDCKFCLDCIRGWRKDGISVAKDNEAVRLCPLCRKESHFIVPSVRFVSSGQEKDGIVEAYKQALGRIPCKNLSKAAACPFGSSCFYYHDPELEQALLRRGRGRLSDFLPDTVKARLDDPADPVT